MPEIEEFLDPKAMARAKQLDPHPTIKVYSIGHEGESNIHFPGFGDKTLQWAQAAVEWIRDKMHIGTPVFNQHTSPNNATDGREQIGEIIGRTTRKLSGVLNTLAAVHIFPDHRDKNLDIASFEAEMSFDHDDVQAWPTGINRITGIALSNSSLDQPGFPGATILGTVQAFAKAQAFADTGVKTMATQAEVKAFAQELNLKPSDLFGPEALIADTAVIEHVKTEKNNLWNQNTRVQGELDKLKESFTTLGETHAAEVKTLKMDNMKSHVTPLFDALSIERKLPEKQSKFIKANLDSFSPTGEDAVAVKGELNTFIDDQQKQYAVIAKDVFGIEEKTEDSTTQQQQQDTVNTDTKSERPPDDDAAAIDESLLDPKNNPLIPAG